MGRCFCVGLRFSNLDSGAVASFCSRREAGDGARAHLDYARRNYRAEDGVREGLTRVHGDGGDGAEAHALVQALAGGREIGRASCRESVWMSVVEVVPNNKDPAEMGWIPWML